MLRIPLSLLLQQCHMLIDHEQNKNLFFFFIKKDSIQCIVLGISLEKISLSLVISPQFCTCHLWLRYFFRYFIKDFPDVILIATLTKQHVKCAWNQEAQGKLSYCFISSSILVHPNPGKACVLNNETSNMVAETVLLQQQLKKLHCYTWLS